jgi:hypothetical protein
MHILPRRAVGRLVMTMGRIAGPPEIRAHDLMRAVVITN